MSSNEDFASELIDRALKLGATSADVVVGKSSELSVTMRCGTKENIERSESVGFGLRVFVGNKSAIISSSKTSDSKTLAQRAVDMAKLASADEYAGLADQKYLATSFKDLDVYDGVEPAPEKLFELALAAEDAARSVKGITNSDGADAAYGAYESVLATSSGFLRGHKSSRFSFSVSVLAGKDVDMQRDYDFASSRHFADLKSPEYIGRSAGEKTVKKLNPQKAKTGSYPIVFDKTVAPDLINDLLTGISGSAVARGTSFLKNKMGEQIFAPNINIIDDPFILRGLASKPFDAEGVACQKLALVESGVLKHWLLDVRTANQLKLAPNGRASRGAGSPPSPGSTNTYLENGTQSFEELIADIKQGLLVTETSGMGVNYTNGDYSVGASGFWIENGKITYPVSEVTIASNLNDMFKTMVAANDLEFNYGCNSPSVRIEGMTLAGA